MRRRCYLSGHMTTEAPRGPVGEDKELPTHSLKPAVLLLFLQGAVQGPEEFAEGLVIGVRSLLGHTVGNTKKTTKKAKFTLAA